ncbi:MAG: DUF1043 family protein, partial [Proteobacteria bacterium]|nr:DUF1043 family protein [Pseudomonadota bacterium]
MMENIVDFILIGSAGLVIGLIAMYLIMKTKGQAGSVEQVEKKLVDYQQNVESHFEKTADLIDDLTDSYKKVFNHLNESAQNLLSDEQIQNQLLNRKDRQVTLSYLK